MLCCLLLDTAVAKDGSQQAVGEVGGPAQRLLAGCCSARKGDRNIAHAVAAPGHIPARQG